ncbi:MAG TPA: RimK/LysX family protein [Alphaproteobacteria bacterium]
MKMRVLLALTIAVLTVSVAHAAAQQAIMGWVERVYIESIDSNFKAKLDTGATTSSMRAIVLKVMDEKDEKNRRVVFQVENEKGETNTLERKLVRFVKIKMRNGTFQRRPVVEMDFCIAGRHVISEVNLAPRTDFIYPVLIGRNMMVDGGIIVDPSRTFTAPARCITKAFKQEEETTPAALSKGE